MREINKNINRIHIVHYCFFALISISILTLVSCAPISSAQIDFGKSVSLVALLSVPENYDGHIVETTGVLIFRTEEHVLYLSELDAKNGVLRNSIWLDFKNNPNYKPFQIKQFEGKYVSVYGKFYKMKKASGHFQNGSITEISEIVPVEEWGRRPEEWRQGE